MHVIILFVGIFGKMLVSQYEYDLSQRPVFLFDVLLGWSQICHDDPCDKPIIMVKALNVLLALLKVLHTAHEQGVIVNDIKVDNII